VDGARSVRPKEQFHVGRTTDRIPAGVPVVGVVIDVALLVLAWRAAARPSRGSRPSRGRGGCAGRVAARRDRAPGPAMTTAPAATGTAVDLFWIPLGAGGHCVRFNGRVYEAIKAARAHRHRCDLYHAALVVEVDGDRHTIEIAPSPDGDGASRGVVATGAVGSRAIGRLRLFRYEVRCWRGGSIPDLALAVGRPCRLSDDPRNARRLLALVPSVPTPVWGRDELTAGDMWNSNSMVAWLIAAAGLPTDQLRPPPGGRAPGWDAGLAVVGRDR
jgi:hypothetical protein